MKVKFYHLIYSSLVSIFFIFISVGCEQKHNHEGLDYERIRAEVDSQNRADDFSRFADNCSKEKVESEFLKWMDSYYPDWPIKGKIKVFEAPEDQNAMIGKPCTYDIRFQTVDPSFGLKEVIVVRFGWNDSRFQGFSIKPVRGHLR